MKNGYVVVLSGGIPGKYVIRSSGNKAPIDLITKHAKAGHELSIKEIGNNYDLWYYNDAMDYQDLPFVARDGDGELLGYFGGDAVITGSSNGVISFLTYGQAKAIYDSLEINGKR